MHIKPVTHGRLVDAVVERLRSLLEEGHFKGGDRLPSASELAEGLGVSRPVLREAVSRLEAMGLLAVRRGRGTFVGNRHKLADYARLLCSAMAFTPSELGEFMEFRIAIECRAARRAAELVSPEDLAELEALCEQINREGQEYQTTIRLDFQFHRRLLAISHNELMRSAMELVQEFVMAGMVRTTSGTADRETRRLHHRALLDAIRARDPDKAEAVMRMHLENAAVRLQQIEEQQHTVREAI
jgi:GntR family transcriptional repressor for pyruvate dehydrogenase complex